MVEHVFRATIWKHAPDQPGSWHFVTLPAGLSDDLAFQAGPRQGFGSIRVEASIGDTTWRTSLFPASAAGALVLPVKEQVQRAEGLQAGESCRIVLRLAAPVHPGSD